MSETFKWTRAVDFSKWDSPKKGWLVMVQIAPDTFRMHGPSHDSAEDAQLAAQYWLASAGKKPGDGVVIVMEARIY